MERVLLLSFILAQWSAKIFGEENITFPILNVTGIEVNETMMLRYGHQRTSMCQEFQKAYFCIMICMQKGYDIAEADKDCVCSCYKDKVKAKYFSTTRDWKIPTTSKPAWAMEDSPAAVFPFGYQEFFPSSDEESKNEPNNTSQDKTDATDATDIGVEDTTLNSDNTNNNESHEGEENNSKEGEGGGEAHHEVTQTEAEPN